MDSEIEARLIAASLTQRNEAIVDARNHGFTIRRIADLVGMSVGGVHKILKENPK